MVRKSLLSVTVVIALMLPPIAETQEHNVVGAVEDGIALATAPIRWGEWGWLLAGGGMVTVGLAAIFDDDLAGQWSNSTDDLAEVGNAYAFVAPAAAVLYYGARGWRGDRAAARTAWAMGESAAFTFVTTGLLKTVVGRERPRGEFNNDGHFHPFTLDDDNHSFPSFHTGLAFSTAAVLQESDLPSAVKATAYGLAALTAWSRMHDDDHWLSDTVAGGLIGYSIGRWAARRQHGHPSYQGRLLPQVGDDRVGLAWQREF